MKGLKYMKKIDSVCMLIDNKITMLKKYKPYGSDVAIDELQDLLNTISTFEYTAVSADGEELEEINRVLTRIASLGKPLTADEFSAKLNKE